MALVYILIIVLQAGVIIYFIRKGRKRRNANVATVGGNTYYDKRDLALSVTPGNLKLAIPGNTMLVYGVVMDWNMGDTVVTLAAYITGASAMYINTGGGMNDAGNYPAVCEAALAFVLAAQDYAGRAMPATTTGLPESGCVRFYLLTNKGTYAAQEQIAYFDDGSSAWLGLFTKGNEVISEMKQYSNNGI